MKRVAGNFTCACLLVCSSSWTRAQPLFSSGFEDGTVWSTFGDPDTGAIFGWDYSALGIPAAPNGDDTIGLRMASNITSEGPGAAAIQVGPADPTMNSFSGQYNVQFDFWLNYDTSAGTTEYGGGGIAFDQLCFTVVCASHLLVNTDGGSETDYLLLDDTGMFLGLESDAYTLESLDHAAPSNDALRKMFPGNPPPESQNTDFGQVVAPNPDGTFGFGWHTMFIAVNAESATYSIDGFEFGTTTVGDGAGIVVLTHWDRSNSVAGNENLAFGVYDNLVVTQVPEPSALLLIIGSLSGLLLAARRRIG